MVVPETWTLIAEADGRGFGRISWVEVAGAQITVLEARRLHEEGQILMAQQRLSSGKMGLLVKLAKYRGRGVWP